MMIGRPSRIPAPLALFAGWALLAAGPVQAADSPARPAHDTRAPIEISADALDVRQAEQIAVFTGKVDAQQGSMRLRADNLKVHYASKAGGTPAPVAAEPAAGPGSQAISKLDATGNVWMTSPKESARGDWAIYDVNKRQITMGGSVILTQGQNVVRGERLVTDLDKGISRIVGAAEAAAGAPPGAAAPAQGGGRVKGLFVPAPAKGEGPK